MVVRDTEIRPQQPPKALADLFFALLRGRKSFFMPDQPVSSFKLWAQHIRAVGKTG
jgi:hypothetical protein